MHMFSFTNIGVEEYYLRIIKAYLMSINYLHNFNIEYIAYI